MRSAAFIMTCMTMKQQLIRVSVNFDLTKKISLIYVKINLFSKAIDNQADCRVPSRSYTYTREV